MSFYGPVSLGREMCPLWCGHVWHGLPTEKCPGPWGVPVPPDQEPEPTEVPC